MSKHNTGKAWDNMGTPDTKPANGDDTITGDGTQPNARSGDPKKV